MKKKILSFLVTLAFLLTAVPLTKGAALEYRAERAAADGSFIQWWLVKDWSDERWLEECDALKEAGMHYLILAPTAFYSYDEKTDKAITRTIYPTRLENCEVLKDDDGEDYPDVVEACLRNARKAGIKVFLGLNFSDDWWANQHDASWVNARMEEGNRIADELWSLYHTRYADTISGWYWCWEVDNLNFKKDDSSHSMQILTDALKIQLDHLSAAKERLPFMLAPFMGSAHGTPEEYAEMWEYVFANSGLQEGDIFSPQDCVGAGGLTMDNYVQWFAALREAVDTKPGLQFWADCETFDAADWTGATMGRFVRQLKDLQPFVDNYVTFAYTHYYSPYNTDPGFHNTYLGYLGTGALETEPPTVPGQFKAELQPAGNVFLSWEAAADNIGVCGYYVYRDGRKIANRQVPRIDDGKNPPVSMTGLVDAVLKPNTAYTYEVQAYDFAGNLSAKSAPLTVTTGEFQYMPNNISKGRLYKVAPEAHKNYPDTGRTELTDGVYADPGNIFDPAWQGWFNDPREVVVGLVQKRPVQQFVIGCLRDPGPSIILPAKISVSVSDDGINYTKVGDFPTPNVPSDDPPARYSYSLTLEHEVEAKYVKFESSPGGGWTFVDEVEVRNNGDSYNNDDIVNDPNDPVLKYDDGTGEEPGQDLPFSISAGCSYTVTPAADANYPDPGGAELTDGVFGDASDPYDPAWQNWWHQGSAPTEIVMDLGVVKNAQQVTANFMKLSSWGINLPASVAVSGSADGVSYTGMGNMQIPSGAGDSAGARLRLTLAGPVPVRYVKLTVDTGGGNVFADEVEVRNSEIPAAVRIAPETIRPGGCGNVTAYIELPEGSDVHEIKLDSIRLNGTVKPITNARYGYVKHPVADYDGDGNLEFMAKFFKKDVTKILAPGTNHVAISGSAGSQNFAGTGTVKVLRGK